MCQRCEIIRKQVSDSVTENEELSAANELSAHIEKARGERELYRQSVKESLEETPTPREVGPVPPVSRDLFKIHYTFDFSQHVTIPHHFRQMGLIYFMAPRRVQVFGVRVDDASLQYNYLVDEDQTIDTVLLGSYTSGHMKQVSIKINK